MLFCSNGGSFLAIHGNITSSFKNNHSNTMAPGSHTEQFRKRGRDWTTTLTGLFNHRQLHFHSKICDVTQTIHMSNIQEVSATKQLRNLRELAWDAFLFGLPWLIPKEVLVYFCYSVMSHPELKKQIFAVPHPKHELAKRHLFPSTALCMTGHEFDTVSDFFFSQKHKFRSLNMSYLI